MSTEKLTVPDVLPQVWEYLAKPHNSVGGSLHVVLDDGNLEDEHIASCREWALENRDADGAQLADMMLRLSWTQRRKVYNRAYEGHPLFPRIR